MYLVLGQIQAPDLKFSICLTLPPRLLSCNMSGADAGKDKSKGDTSTQALGEGKGKSKGECPVYEANMLSRNCSSLLHHNEVRVSCHQQRKMIQQNHNDETMM